MSHRTALTAVAAATCLTALTGAAAADAAPASHSAPARAFLTSAAAEATFGAYGYTSWAQADTVPTRLRFGTCAAALPQPQVQILRDRDRNRDDASIRSAVREFGSEQRATRISRRVVAAVRDCVESHPLPSIHFSTDAGRAIALGRTWRGRHAAKVEYVVVSRAVSMVEVSAFHQRAQYSLGKSTIRALARREFARLARVS